MTTLGEARDDWFHKQGLPLDGGYTKKWVPLKLGPIPLAIPNTSSRKQAVPLHDLHHLLTGYQTDWVGEFEIAAWEIAAGCGRYSFAWMINLQGLAAGAVVFPVRTWRAWARGRRSRTLYNHAVYGPTLLASELDDWRAKLGLVDEASGSRQRATFSDWRMLPLYLAAVALGIASVAAPLVLAGWWIFLLVAA
jgi:hypothetical protein